MGNMRLWTLGAVAGLVLAVPVMAEPVSADPVIAAERAFAARHQQVSVKEAFQEFSAADGVALTPDGVKNVKEYIASWPDNNNAGLIQWWPTMAGIAQSGDFGFTTGPASYGGGKSHSQYFTVWKKQADGSWKWLIDQGTRHHQTATAPTSDVAVVPVADVPAIDASKAWQDLEAADIVLGKAPATAAETADHYAANVRLLGYRALPRDGIEAAKPILAARAADLQMTPAGGGVSAAGDLGYTYGTAAWTQEGKAIKGSYLRVWQRGASGWKVLVENVNPV